MFKVAPNNRSKPRNGALAYPEHVLDDPQECLCFVEASGFYEDWIDLGMTDEDLRVAETFIQAEPAGYPVIPGTGGLRKMRFATPKRAGVRKWVRICYVYFPEASLVYLVVAYSKNERANLSAADKKAFKAFIQREHAVLASRAVK
jgi:hypothetical protein